MFPPVPQRLRRSHTETLKIIRLSLNNGIQREGLYCSRADSCWKGRVANPLACRSLHQAKCLGQEDIGLAAKSNFLDKYKRSLTFPNATHKFKELPYSFHHDPEGRPVILHGYTGAHRDMSKKLSFMSLHDPSYEVHVQIISSFKDGDDDLQAAQEKLKSIPVNTPVTLQGILRAKPERDRKCKGPVGVNSPLQDFEIALQDIQSLNDFPEDIIMTPDTEFSPEQRHLQIRTNRIVSKALALRSEIKQILSHDLTTEYGFTEIETPLLFKSTSEGAREFIVPTRRKGLAYALPQSPQQFKQILMASGIYNYYQFAKCFRDEDLRADRQPEFTQLDIERGFANAEDIILVVERLISKLWKTIMNVELQSPIPRLTYKEAMSRYGSDKPDLRIPIAPFVKVQNFLPCDLISMITPLKNPIVEAMVVPMEDSPSEIRNFIGGLLDSAENKRFLDNADGGPGVFIYDSSKPLNGLSAFGFAAVEYIEQNVNLEDGHLIVLQARADAPLRGGSTPLGDLRTTVYRTAVKHGLMKPSSWTDFRPLWVTDFPLFSPPSDTEPGQGGNAGLASTHHPFTSPKSAADVDLLHTDPANVIGDHYDLVINGEEIGGGSRRIHHAQMQEFIFRDILKMNEEHIAEFSHLLEALRSGCPPHAGIALGFDRVVAMIHGSLHQRTTSLRDVIAFPKSSKGEDLMVKSPGSMAKEVLETYHLQLKDGDIPESLT